MEYNRHLNNCMKFIQVDQNKDADNWMDMDEEDFIEALKNRDIEVLKHYKKWKQWQSWNMWQKEVDDGNS